MVQIFWKRHTQYTHRLCFQVMWPSLYLGLDLSASPIHAKAMSLAKSLMGPDMEFDFDMLITKEGGTMTETPWHCDEAYWLPDMPDKRALSFWFPMTDVDVVRNLCRIL